MAYAQDPRREHFLVTLLKTFFVSIPLALAGFFIGLAASIPNEIVHRFFIGTAVVFYAALYLTVLLAPEFIGFIPDYFIREDSSHALALTPVVSYAFYLLLSLPIFFVLSYLGARWGSPLEKMSRSYRMLTLGWMKRQRKASGKKRIFLGGSLWTGKPVYLTDEMRVMHTQVVGSTGSGKTESVLLPMLAHDIRTGKGAIILDGKGDLDLRDKIWWIVKENKREKDFSFFSLSYPELSNTYNPLLKGNATEIKDKLIARSRSAVAAEAQDSAGPRHRPAPPRAATAIAG
jgi:hypothetical protein